MSKLQGLWTVRPALNTYGHEVPGKASSKEPSRRGRYDRVPLSAQVRPKAFSNIRIQEPNTFLGAENAMNAQAREGVCHGKEFHPRPESYNINCFSFVLEFRHPNYRIGAPTCAHHTVPYGTALLGGAFPGTSCQATIAPSLRDVLQQASCRSASVSVVPASCLSSNS